MPYANTSLQAEQRALSEKMRELGMSYRKIAVEFARRHRVRPSAGWRSAHAGIAVDVARGIDLSTITVT